MNPEIFAKFKDLLYEQSGKDPAYITESTTCADLEMDSLDTVELTMAVEAEFDIDMPDEVVENLHTVADWVKAIEERVAA